MYSADIFNSLYRAYADDDYTNNRDFWYIVDHLDLNHLILWSERLSKQTYLSDVDAKAWLDIIDIIRLAKSPDVKLTTKQKRYMAMCVIGLWNDLSCDYEI